MLETLEPRCLCWAVATVVDAPPAPPTELVGVSRMNLFIRLAFTDNSTDEETFVVEGSRDGYVHRRWIIPGSAPGEIGGRVFVAKQGFRELGVSNAFTVRAVNAAGESAPVSVRLDPYEGPPPTRGPVYYHNDRFFGGEPVVVDDTYPKTNVDFGTGSPAAGVRADAFSSTWEAFVFPELRERYTFHAASNDGIALRLTDARDGRVIFDFDNLHAQRELPPAGFQDVAGSVDLGAPDLQPGLRYLLTVRFSENVGRAGYRVGWSSFSTPQEPIPLERLEPIAPGGPKVVDVDVGSSEWPAAVRGFVYSEVNTGPAQLTPLPWTNLNQVSLRFDRGVTIDASDLRILGATGALYSFEAFTPPSDSNYHVATWTLDRPIGADRVTLQLNSNPATGGVVGAFDGRQPLDGEWTDGAAAVRSGNGQPGGDFVFRFNVLPGDANRDGRVDARDLAAVRGSARARPGTGTATRRPTTSTATAASPPPTSWRPAAAAGPPSRPSPPPPPPSPAPSRRCAPAPSPAACSAPNRSSPERMQGKTGRLQDF